MIENHFKESLRNDYKKYIEMKNVEEDTTEDVSDEKREICRKLLHLIDGDDEQM